MNSPENFPEFTPSLVDEQLTQALVKLDTTFRGLICLYIGDTLYAQGVMLAQLDKELEEDLSKETREILQEYAASENQAAAEAARDMLSGGAVFDEDEERAIVEEAQYDTVGQTFADPSRASEDVYTEAFGVVSHKLRSDIEALLIDKYPEITVVSIDEGCIAFAVQKGRIDASTEQFLSIMFNTHEKDLISNVAYSYYSIDLESRRSQWVPIDIDALGGEIEGISLDTLKQDTTRAINIVIEAAESM